MLFRSQERILWESDSGKISLIEKGPARRILPLMTDAVVYKTERVDALALVDVITWRGQMLSVKNYAVTRTIG